MEKLANILTKISLSTDYEIDIKYCFYNQTRTMRCKCHYMDKFDSIRVIKDDEIIKLPFFNSKLMIKSISFAGHEEPLYINNLIDSTTFSKGYLSNKQVRKIKKEILNGEEEEISKRSIKLNNYNIKSAFFKFEDLFFTEKQEQQYKHFIDELFKELKQFANEKDVDGSTNYVDKGCTSYVYSIGDKILKIGKTRRNKTIPYFHRVLQPIVNRNYYFDGIPIHIEITEKILDRRAINNDLNLIDKFNAGVKEILKELDEAGLRLKDNNIYNFGILTKENKIHYKHIKSDVASDSITSITNNNNYMILEAGEVVILDLDSIIVIDEIKYSNYLKSLRERKIFIR